MDIFYDKVCNNMISHCLTDIVGIKLIKLIKS